MKIVRFPSSSSSSIILQPIVDPMSLHNDLSAENIHLNSSMTSPIANFPIVSTRLRTLIVKKQLSTRYTQVTQDEKADPKQDTNDPLENVPNIPNQQINFMQYLHLHSHPDAFVHKCDVMTQTDHTTIKPKPFPRNQSNRLRTSSGK